MPIDAAEPFVGKESSRTAGKLIVLKYLFKEDLDFFAVFLHHFCITRLFFQFMENSRYIFDVSNVAIEMIIAILIPDHKRFIVLRCQSHNQGQTTNFFRSYAILFEKTR